MTAKRNSPLTKTEILSAALALIDAEGADALSMRRLARELGVEAMSLYHHVTSKQALLDGVVELALVSAAPPVPPASGHWQDIVAASVGSFRRALIAHPNALPLMIAHPPTAPEASRVYIEMPLRFLLQQGFTDRNASELFEAVFALSFGHALLSTNYPAIQGEGVPTVDFTEQSFDRTVRMLLAGYAAER